MVTEKKDATMDDSNASNIRGPAATIEATGLSMVVSHAVVIH